MNRSVAANGAAVFLAFFGLPFAAVGVFTTGMIYYTVASWIEVLDWQETSATIVTAEVKRSNDPDSDGFRTEATYEYQWGRDTYTGDRVGLFTESDNVGSYQERVAQELTSHLESGEPFRCYVDPTHPSDSILYRELRWEMMAFLSVFGAIFATVGGGLIYSSLASIPSSRRESELEREFPKEPWRHKAGWAEGDIRPSVSSWRWLPVLAGWWGLATFPAGIGALNDLTRGNGWAIFGFILPGIAMLIVRAAIKSRARRRFFGKSRIELDRFPMITGGTTSGRVLIENDVGPWSTWHFDLECEETTESGDSTNTETIFEQSQTIEETKRSETWGQTSVPFTFTLPFSTRPTSENGREKIEWKLNVRSERTEVEFKQEFEIPVFRTEESSRSFKAELSDEKDTTDEADERLGDLHPDGPLMKARLKVAEQPDGTVSVFAEAGRYFKAGLSMGLFAVIWDGICVVLWYADGVPCVFPILFSLFGALITWAAFDIAFRSSRLEIGRESLTFRTGWCGRGREHTIPLSEIQDVDVESKMSIGSTQYPDVIITLRSARKHTVMSHIRGRMAAERVMERILEAVTR